MAADDKIRQVLKDDAVVFLSRLADVERVLQLLTPTSILEESTAHIVLRALDEIDCLKFAAWSVALDAEDLFKGLSEAGVESDAIKRIEAFAIRYRDYARFLTRLHRSDQGYENELTRISVRPSIQLYSQSAMVTLQIYNRDQLIVNSSNSVDGLLNFIEMLIDAVNDTTKLVGASAPELLSTVVDADALAGVLDGVETLKRLTSATMVDKAKT